MSLLSIHNVGKSYGNVKALTDFSAELDCGVYALLGPNGSGKSTLMNILTDNLAMDSGKILYNGKSIYSLGKEYRAALGFMPQYPGMYPTFSVNDCLKYMAVLKGVPRREAKAQIAGLLERVELSDVAKHPVRSMSGGMKQRLALAQAFIGNPRIVILDEPTAGLDPKQRINVRNFISEMSLDRCIIIATHIVSDVENIATRVIMLKKGIIQVNDAPREIISGLDGRVWNVPQSDGVTDGVISVRNDGGNVILRVLSDVKPSPNAEKAPRHLRTLISPFFQKNDSNKTVKQIVFVVAIRIADNLFSALQNYIKEPFFRVRSFAVAASDRAGVDFKDCRCCKQLLQRFIRSGNITGMVCVKKRAVLVEFSNEVKMTDDIALGFIVNITYECVIVLDVCIKITAVMVCDVFFLLFGAFVNCHVSSVLFYVMYGTYYIIISVCRCV